jgi:hypothetical protein
MCMSKQTREKRKKWVVMSLEEYAFFIEHCKDVIQVVRNSVFGMDVPVIGIAVICKISDRECANTARYCYSLCLQCGNNQYEDTVNTNVIATWTCMFCVVYT